MTTLPDPTGPGRRRSPADRLIELARDHYRPVLGQDGRAYAVPLSGPALACPVQGGRDSLRSRLAHLYYDTCGRAARGPALTAAVAALACEAETAEPVPVALRVARPSPRRAVVDLGDRAGRCVIVESGGWLVVERPPVVFRRTTLTGELPTPTQGHPGALERLRQLANLRSPVAWRLALGWLVAALLAEPAPVLALTGPASAGKSCAARMLVELVDPQPAPLRRRPRDVRDWATAAGASWVVALDDIGAPTPWLADILARATDGAGIVRRNLRAPAGDVDVLTLRRAVLVTAQARGPLSAALGPRAAVVPLPPLTDRQRRPEADVRADYADARPLLLGALLDTVARVLAVLPDVEPCELDGPCGDFACIPAALDACGATQR